MATQIPLGSRIIAVADVYDVLTARDTYREPVSTAEAFAELRRSAGTQLDAELVEVFIEPGQPPRRRSSATRARTTSRPSSRSSAVSATTPRREVAA